MTVKDAFSAGLHLRQRPVKEPPTQGISMYFLICPVRSSEYSPSPVTFGKMMYCPSARYADRAPASDRVNGVHHRGARRSRCGADRQLEASGVAPSAAARTCFPGSRHREAKSPGTARPRVSYIPGNRQALSGRQRLRRLVPFLHRFENVGDEGHVVMIDNGDRVQIMAPAIGDQRLGIGRSLFSGCGVLALPVRRRVERDGRCPIGANIRVAARNGM